MKHGFSFVWPCGKTPYFILPNGQVVALEVSGDIPYLCPGIKRCQPRPMSSKSCPVCGHKHAGRKGRTAPHPAAAVPAE
eukprot:2281456-Alexandrium_andersonii.AAC.1